MIEIFRKGFRLDVSPDQVVTFKKAQNLNGIQARYAYSNTGSMDKTANNKKLLELFDLPTNKVSSLMNGFTVDVILNGSIQLRNQTFTIQKETLDKINWYLLYSDNALVVKLKEVYINQVVKDFKYKKTVADYAAKAFDIKARTMLLETQPSSGLFVLEEMPIALQLQEVIRLIFTQNGYTVYGDFFEPGSEIEEYYIAPNKGVYQVYGGSGDGFSPSFDETLDAYKFLTDTLAYFNCYADVDDTYRTVIINRWTNLGNYKTTYVDYSKQFVNYQDYAFQSKLAKRNEMTYADSGSTFNSFFPNNLSSQDKSTYLSSAFGTGSLNIFDNSDIEDDGTIPTRSNGAVGESSAVRIFKVGSSISTKLYINGTPNTFTGFKAQPVSMQEVYTRFHKDYTDFILSPFVTNLIFNYDEIMAADFKLTKVFFVEQLSSYWIPLEINFSTKKDQIIVKAMLIKKRKVESPILNNLNAIELDFKERAIVPLELLLSMYPMPPNRYDWDVIIFKSYDQNLNRLYVNDVLIPANSLPQAFSVMTDVIKIEANKPADTGPDKNTASFYVQALDTNGGVSNEAYITVKHTGVASLQSDFYQIEPISHTPESIDSDTGYVNVLSYTTGPKPNLNLTITSVAPILEPSPTNDFNLVTTTEAYPATTVEVLPFTISLATTNIGAAKGMVSARLIIYDGTVEHQMFEVSVGQNSSEVFNIPYTGLVIPSLASGKDIAVYIRYSMVNLRPLMGQISASIVIEDMQVKIATTKII
jgi:hypothetical protein